MSEQSQNWWGIFTLLAVLFVADLFIIDPLPLIDEIVLGSMTGVSFITAIINSIRGR